jgi:hypothetical protein
MPQGSLVRVDPLGLPGIRGAPRVGVLAYRAMQRRLPEDPSIAGAATTSRPSGPRETRIATGSGSTLQGPPGRRGRRARQDQPGPMTAPEAAVPAAPTAARRGRAPRALGHLPEMPVPRGAHRRGTARARVPHVVPIGLLSPSNAGRESPMGGPPEAVGRGTEVLSAGRSAAAKGTGARTCATPRPGEERRRDPPLTSSRGPEAAEGARPIAGPADPSGPGRRGRRRPTDRRTLTGDLPSAPGPSAGPPIGRIVGRRTVPVPSTVVEAAPRRPRPVLGPTTLVIYGARTVRTASGRPRSTTTSRVTSSIG